MSFNHVYAHLVSDTWILDSITTASSEYFLPVINTLPVEKLPPE